jgi:hypothetical protein
MYNSNGWEVPDDRAQQTEAQLEELLTQLDRERGKIEDSNQRDISLHKQGIKTNPDSSSPTPPSESADQTLTPQSPTSASPPPHKLPIHRHPKRKSPQH